MTERIFRTLNEVKDTFFPNISIEELEGEKTVEEIQEELKKIIEASKKATK